MTQSGADFQFSQDLITQGRFDKSAALLAYTNVPDAAAPTVTCSQANLDGTCPADPTPPTQPQSTNNGTAHFNDSNGWGSLNAYAEHDKCTFLSGGALTSGTYTQSAKNSASANITTKQGPKTVNNEVWTYTWTYDISGNVAPQTAWNITSSGTPFSNVQVALNGWIANETVTNTQGTGNKNSNPWSTKANFPTPTVTSFGATVKDASGNVYFGPLADLMPSLTAQTGVDFPYAAGAGTSTGANGNTDLLFSGAPISTILNAGLNDQDGFHDDFAGNNCTPGGACGNRVNWATPQITLPVQSAIYSVDLAGNVAGISGAASGSFDVTVVTVISITGDLNSCPAFNSASLSSLHRLI